MAPVQQRPGSPHVLEYHTGEYRNGRLHNGVDALPRLQFYLSHLFESKGFGKDSARAAQSFVAMLKSEIERLGISRVSLKILADGDLQQLRVDLDDAHFIAGSHFIFLNGVSTFTLEWASVLGDAELLGALLCSTTNDGFEDFMRAHSRSAGGPASGGRDVLVFEGSEARENLAALIKDIASSVRVANAETAGNRFVETLVQQLDQRGVQGFTLICTLVDAATHTFKVEISFESRGEKMVLAFEGYGLAYRDDLGNCTSVPWETLLTTPSMVSMLLDAPERLAPIRELQRALADAQGGSPEALLRLFADEDDGSTSGGEGGSNSR